MESHSSPEPARPRTERYPISCSPPVWARGGHAQTILAHLLPSRGGRIGDGQGAWRRLLIGLDAGERLGQSRKPAAQGETDQLCVFVHPGSTGIRVHLMHGLSGDVNADYMKRTAHVLIAAGHEVWAINHCGCGEGRGLARQAYHSGKTADLQCVLRRSMQDTSAEVRIVLGFSLSGNLALLYAGQHLTPAPDAVIAVNPPVDLRRAAVDIERGLNRIYELRFMQRLVREIRRRQREGEFSEAGKFSRWSSMLTLDDEFTAPVCGFAGGDDYYEQCSSRPFLESIRVPTVILASEDDPFVRPESYHEFDGTPQVQLHRERWGGHLGYLGRGWWRGQRWLDGALRHYVEALAARGGRR